MISVSVLFPEYLALCFLNVIFHRKFEILFCVANEVDLFKSGI